MIADWYFDFVSLFSYFGLRRLDELPAGVEVRFHPVVFAGLLDHWGQLGPAEIPSKRAWTYRWCTWQAEQLEIPFRMPAAHPFNPIAYLRLAIAADCTASSIQSIFDALWTTGADPQDTHLFEALAERIGIDPANIEQQEIKDRLRTETNDAIATGVFGVPTFVIDGHLFWGADSVTMASAYLSDPAILQSDEMKRIRNLPTAAKRAGRK